MRYLLRDSPRRVTLSILASVLTVAAQQPPNISAQNHVELPVTMKQKVVAGVTPVGTTVKAKLAIATLINGEVVPQGATLTGKVEESVKKTADSPARLRIRMDTATWKEGTVPLEIYFTGCYYPVELASRPHDPFAHSTYEASIGTTMGRTPGAEDPLRASPGRMGSGGGLGSDWPADFPPRAPETTTQVSSHWVRMEGVNALRDENGAVTVTSAKDLKLDKHTTYLLEDAPPPARK